MDSEIGLFGGGWQDYHDKNIKPVLDDLDRQISDIRFNGMEGQLARMQLMDDITRAPDADAGGASIGRITPIGGTRWDTLNNYGDDPNFHPGHIGVAPSVLGETPAAVMFGATADPQLGDLREVGLKTAGVSGANTDDQGLIAKAKNIYNDISGFLTSPEFTEPLKRQGQYVNRAGDIVGLGGQGLAVAGAATAQPELVAPGVVGMGVGGVLNVLGNIGIVASDILANDRNAAVRDSVGAGVSSVLPPTVDPQPTIDRTGRYFGY